MFNTDLIILKIKDFSCLSIVLLFALGCTPSQQQEGEESQRPNIIFVMTDDHAQQAISSYGSNINQTPNLDRLAEEGMRFENSFVTNSICAPSRAVLLTGKYSHINGQLDNYKTFDGSQPTFPKMLQEAGYTTAMIGKWHLKSQPTGFDYWKVLPGQGNYYNPDFIEMGDTIQEQGYVTDLITDEVLSWIDQQKDQEKPFSVLYHHKAPHRQWWPGPEHLDMYEDQKIPEPETLRDDYEGRQAAQEALMQIMDHMYMSRDLKLRPEVAREAGYDELVGPNAYLNNRERMTEEQLQQWDEVYGPVNEAFQQNPPEGDELLQWKYQRYIKDYLRCIASVDDNMGRLLDYLDKNNLAENTIVVYTSDQGFYLGEHGWYDKRFMYEESLRTPLLVRYPGKVEPGSTTEKFALNLDLAPTFLDYAGVEIPEAMQGRSLKPLLEQNNPEDWRDAMYYHYYEYPAWHGVKRHYGVRTNRYKLIHFYYDIDQWELYDLQEDPNEMNNLIDNPEYDDVEGRLRDKLQSLREKYKDSTALQQQYIDNWLDAGHTESMY